MARPRLYVIGGCNGSGKSSFANAITPDGVDSFDYDKEFLSIYNSMSDSELRTQIAHSNTRALLEESVAKAIENDLDFCYETNFNSTPMYWPEKFREVGFELNLFFFCLDSMDKAKKRVQIRVENEGHYVPEKEIEERYKLGYENLNKLFSKFDFVHLLNSSFYDQEPNHMLTIKSGQLMHLSDLPDFLKELTPSIAKLQE